jgi:hypothetical protein
MTEIPVFRIHTERIKKDKFSAVAEHLGLRGNVASTSEALFIQNKQRALAYAMPGSRFAGLLFFTDQSKGMATPIERAPSSEEVKAWTDEFLKRFQLGPRETTDKQIRVSFATKVFRTESAVEDGKGVKRVPVKTDIVSDVRVNDHYVTGPRAKVRLVFKSAKAPVWIHRALWEKLEVFETRSILTENEVYRKVSDRMTRRGETHKRWRMISIRLTYFAGEYSGGPDLLLPYYFAEIELRDPKDQEWARQGPRQLIQIPA